jgi:hypothetical protein
MVEVEYRMEVWRNCYPLGNEIEAQRNNRGGWDAVRRHDIFVRVKE